MTARELQSRLKRLARPKDAVFLQRFFKTGPGEYGEGDRFLGIRVPVLRKLAREACDLPLGQTLRLLHSPFHEARMLALLILANQMPRAADNVRRDIYDCYLDNIAHINNWDLVDVTSPHVVGAYLADRDRRVLDRLARSPSLWERRIAIVSTHWFIRHGEFHDTIRIAGLLLNDTHDLIHKAVGWMLREVGKRDASVLHGFLGQHCRRMPRTMLRYAIERLPENIRSEYRAGRIG
ncbi:MAG: DNA alkylation repair protein [Tepidisphaeraceae bacterium]|jgi:3-methyladenine DNA glycosylase AlkD